MQFIRQSLQTLFSDFAKVDLLQQKDRWVLERRCIPAFAGEYAELVPSSHRKSGGLWFYSAFNYGAPHLLGGEAIVAFHKEQLNPCSYYVVPGSPSDCLLRCVGALPTIETLRSRLGMARESDLVIIESDLAWTFILYGNDASPDAAFALNVSTGPAPI